MRRNFKPLILLTTATAAIAVPHLHSPSLALSPYEPEYQCDPPVTQLDTNFCARDDFLRKDDRLNALYDRLLPTLSDTAATAIVDAQLAWIDHRDAQCDFSASAYAGGSIYPTILHSCRAAFTQRRADELAVYLDDRRPISETDDLIALEAERAAFHHAITQILADNDTRRQLFLDSERAWTNYRDAACEFESILGQMPGLQNCKLRLTEQRVARLREYVEAAEF